MFAFVHFDFNTFISEFSFRATNYLLPNRINEIKFAKSIRFDENIIQYTDLCRVAGHRRRAPVPEMQQRRSVDMSVGCRRQ